MIQIGTMIRGNGGKAARRLEGFLDAGFESFQFHWWETTDGENLTETAGIIREELQTAGIPGIPLSLGLYGNPLRPGERGHASRKSIRHLIQSAGSFGSPFLGLFTGRIPDTPWEESIPAFSEYFEELCREAADHGVKLALENCPMEGGDDSGDWNLAYNPGHWERLYSALSSTAGDNLYLEWEPAHQILQGLDPIAGLRTWSNRVIHIHGKDARRDADQVVQTLPGNGDTDWSEIFRILKDAGYRGTADIEGYHDPEWKGEKEIEGQKKSTAYLKNSRDGRCSGSSWQSLEQE